MPNSPRRSNNAQLAGNATSTGIPSSGTASSVRPSWSRSTSSRLPQRHHRVADLGLPGGQAARGAGVCHLNRPRASESLFTGVPFGEHHRLLANTPVSSIQTAPPRGPQTTWHDATAVTDLRLQEQRDESQLHSLLDRFFAALDEQKWQIAEGCLAEEPVLDLRIYGGSDGPQPVSAADFIGATRQRLEPLRAIEHRATSSRFTVDGTSALGQTHARIRIQTPHGRLTRYADLSCRFVRESRRWAIQRLDFALVRDDGDLGLLS